MHDPLDDEGIALLFQGKVAALCIGEGRWRKDAPQPKAVLPGSFNPLHQGHRDLAAAAANRLGCEVPFELSIVNADKPGLPIAEVLRRLEQFRGRGPVWLTLAPTFLEKSTLFPGCVFVVGLDTAERILDLRYYGADQRLREEALQAIVRRGCRFLVGGRVDAAGAYRDIDTLSIPDGFRDLFYGIPGTEFRCDVSSTQIRSSTGQG